MEFQLKWFITLLAFYVCSTTNNYSSPTFGRYYCSIYAMKYYQSIVIKSLTPCPAIKLNFWTLKYLYLKRTKTYQLKCFLIQLTRKNSGKRYSYTEKPLDHQICLKAKDIFEQSLVVAIEYYFAFRRCFCCHLNVFITIITKKFLIS